MFKVIKVAVCDGKSHPPHLGPPDIVGFVRYEGQDLNFCFRDLEDITNYLRNEFNCVCRYEVQ